MSPPFDVPRGPESHKQIHELLSDDDKAEKYLKNLNQDIRMLDQKIRAISRDPNPEIQHRVRTLIAARNSMARVWHALKRASDNPKNYRLREALRTEMYNMDVALMRPILAGAANYAPMLQQLKGTQGAVDLHRGTIDAIRGNPNEIHSMLQMILRAAEPHVIKNVMLAVVDKFPDQVLENVMIMFVQKLPDADIKRLAPQFAPNIVGGQGTLLGGLAQMGAAMYTPQQLRGMAINHIKSSNKKATAKQMLNTINPVELKSSLDKILYHTSPPELQQLILSNFPGGPEGPDALVDITASAAQAARPA